MKVIGEIRDTIEWNFKDDKFSTYPEHLRGKTFTAEIACVNLDDEAYGVYAEYGQDYIPFDMCKIIKKAKS